MRPFRTKTNVSGIRFTFSVFFSLTVFLLKYDHFLYSRKRSTECDGISKPAHMKYQLNLLI